MATWPSGKAEACKAFTPGSNPGVASKFVLSPPSRVVFLIPDTHFLPRWPHQKSTAFVHSGEYALSIGLYPDELPPFKPKISSENLFDEPDPLAKSTTTLTMKKFSRNTPCAQSAKRYNTFLRADVAQLVEHNLAKVGVAGSNPVVRSIDH